MKHFQKYSMLKISKKEALVLSFIFINLIKVNSDDNLTNNNIANNNSNNEIEENQNYKKTK